MLKTKEDNNSVSWYNKPGRLVPSHLRTPQGMKCLVLVLVVLVLSHWDTREREVVGYRDDHYILHEHTFSNTGNIPTLHQPTLVTVTTITHTHWPHHLPQVWFGSYVLQDIAQCSGCEDCECPCVSKHNCKQHL